MTGIYTYFLFVQIQQLQVQANELPRLQQQLQEVQSQADQLQATVQQLAALKARVAELQAEVRTIAAVLRLQEQHDLHRQVI